MNIAKATELSILEYAASLDLNPENVFYQRVRANSATPSNIQWSIITPDVRSVLLSWATVDYNLTFQHIDQATGNNLDTVGNQMEVSFKPIMAMTNAQTSQTVSINGNSITMSQPRNFIENLSRLNVGVGEDKCFDSKWWSSQGGVYGGGRQQVPAAASQLDEGFLQNEKTLKGKLGDTIAPSAGAHTIGLDTGTYREIHYSEPLLCPPFNPFAKLKSGMPDYMPMKWMSSVIPNIKQLQVSLQFNAAKIEAGSLFYRYNERPVNADVPQWKYSSIDADLLLYWYQVPTTMSIPRAPVLQTWNMTEYQNQVSNNVVANSADVPTTLSPLIQLESVPGFFIIHARRRQDDQTYVARAMFSTTNNGAINANPVGSYGADGTVNPNADHSLDTFMEIRNMRIQLGSRPDAISTDFSQRQLYDITLKNAKYRYFSLDFVNWKGELVKYDPFLDTESLSLAHPVEMNFSTGPESLNQLSRSFVCLQPKDVAQQVSGGVRFPNSLLVQAGLRARDGACAMAGGDHNYDLFVHVFVNKHWIRIEPDRAQYEEQSVTLQAATQILLGSGQQLDSLATGGAYQAKF